MNRRLFMAAIPTFAASLATLKAPLMREVDMFYWYESHGEYVPAYRCCDFCYESAWEVCCGADPRRLFELLDDSGCCCCETCVPALLRGEFDE